MSTHLVCYATPEYHAGQRRLTASATRFGVEQVHAWDRPRLAQTAFYDAHRSILDLPRGGGYWLWKPHLVFETLTAMNPGATLFYADSGIEVVADLSPLVALCSRQGGLLVFAGHYYRHGKPNECGSWTKRDCFVEMNCDEPRYHHACMVDASFLVLEKCERSMAVVNEWLRYCKLRSVLTDDPNVCGLDNLPGFVEHRHDQSVLSLVTERHRLELFRHPSQFGNHLKLKEYRRPNEPIRFPYDTFEPFRNSPYPTLLDHHRMGRASHTRFARS